MAKVKCEYCGHFINDTAETCPVCGAINNSYKRHSEMTPQTIDELKTWYISRNLPSEEITRFFIGKNIKEPRAFGIYEDDGQFIVYKNKSDGTRAVRYQGTDEAYAVNELYIRLKEEIANQKSINTSRKLANHSMESYQQSLHNAQKSMNNYNNFGTRKKTIGCLIPLLLFMFMPSFFFLPFFALVDLNDIFDDSPSYNYYMSNNDDIYYCEGYDVTKNGYDWWKYDKNANEWFLYDTFNNDTTYPDGVIEDAVFYSAYDIAEKTNIDYRNLNIQYSKSFIDDGNHQTPQTSYYYYDNNLYYFLDDIYGADYGTSDNTGWYIYKDNEWNYYCDEDSKERLGDELWYYADDYSAGDNYNNLDTYINNSSIPSADFENTNWYKSYESNEEAYKDYINQNKYDNDSNDGPNWGSDSDYDWDSIDSWDSGDTDWNSDW